MSIKLVNAVYNNLFIVQYTCNMDIHSRNGLMHVPFMYMYYALLKYLSMSIVTLDYNVCV